MTLKAFVTKLVPPFLLKIYHYKMTLLSAILFGFPAKKLIVIGVTGTSGKSTTVDFITRILEESFDSTQDKSGSKVASVSSIRFKVGDKEWKNELKMTMPGRFTIHKFLRQAVREKCKYAVLEVTSEGIKQFRHKFINFDTAVFTNLSPEHIESHGGFENYRSEKLKLFKENQDTHIINTDDKNARYFLEIPAKKIVTFGFNEGELRAKNISSNSFTVNGTQFNLNILGDFNVYNSLAAISVALNYGISLDICKKALEKVSGVDGRMEIVAKAPLVVVDYAHTPEQLEQVYKTLVNLKSEILNHKLICVLGSCGGGRDKWKRPVLGRLASQYCKEIIITNEDPYDENPLSIMNEIESGFSQILNPKSQIPNNIQIQNPKYEKILDRRQAIKKAIELAKLGDMVIITGKGSEPWMCIANNQKIPWDDREIVRQELKKTFTP